MARGGKYRTTWVDYPALAAVHHYPGLDRAAVRTGRRGGRRGVGEPPPVTEPVPAGAGSTGCGSVGMGSRPGQRRRLVAPEGGSCLLAVRSDGGPFTAWESAFTRASQRIRRRFEPRFPHVHPHRLRHSFALATLERLVGGYYAQAAGLVMATRRGGHQALALYLAKSTR